MSKRLGKQTKNWIRIVLFIAYCSFIIWMTLLCRRVTVQEYEIGLFWGLRMWLNGEPQGWSVFVQYINNILFFIPFGLFLSGIVKKIKIVIVAGAIVSALIEIMQYITARGLAELDDVISNSVGAFIGWLLWKAGKRLVERYKSVR